MHEHIVLALPPACTENWPHLFERNAILAMAEQKLADLHTRGIRTIVDLTTVDLGRDIDLIADVARRSPVQVIVATGVWRMPQRHFAGHGVDAVAELFVRDLTQGIGTSGMAEEAAIIKCATDTEGVTLVIATILRAAGVTTDQIEQMLVRRSARDLRGGGVVVADDKAAGADDNRYLKHYRLGFAVTAMLLLAIAVYAAVFRRQHRRSRAGSRDGQGLPAHEAPADVAGSHVHPAPRGRDLDRRDPPVRDAARLRPSHVLRLRLDGSRPLRLPRVRRRRGRGSAPVDECPAARIIRRRVGS